MMVQSPHDNPRCKLAETVRSLPFCNRTHNLLTRNGIETIIDVLCLRQNDLLGIKGVGPTTVEEIKSVTYGYLSSLIRSYSASEVRQAVRTLKCRNIFNHQPDRLPQGDQAPVSLDNPIETFTISTRARNALLRSGIRTVSDLLSLSEDRIQDIRYVGEKTYQDIRILRQELELELLFNRLLDSVCKREPHVEGKSFTEVAAVDEEHTPTAPWTSIDTLPLSKRTRNALVNGGIRTVGDLLRATDSDIRDIKNIGEKTLAEIQVAREGLESLMPPITNVSPEPKSSLTQTTMRKLRDVGIDQLTELGQHTVEDLALYAHLTYAEVQEVCGALADTGLCLSTQWPEYPLVKSSDYQFLKRTGIPLSDISISRLALPSTLETRLWQLGIETIDAIASQSKVVLENTLGPHSQTHIVSIEQNLKTYFEWLLSQQDWDDEVASRGISPLCFVWLRETTLERIINVLLSYVPREKDRRVIRLRFGLDGAGRRTLQEVGDRLGVSRERVRQVENRTVQRLRVGSRDGLVQALYHSIENETGSRGGLITIDQLSEYIAASVDVGEVHANGAILLLLSLRSDRFVAVQKDRRWALSDLPLELIKSVSRELTQILQRFHAPLPLSSLMNELTLTELYALHKEELSRKFIEACLSTNERFERAQDGQWALTRWQKHRTDKIVIALRKLGKPSHYTEIAQVANDMLPTSRRASDHVYHAQLGNKPHLFVWVGRGVYGLAEWGLQRPRFYVDIAEELLEQRREPLTFDEMFPFINAEREASPESIKFMLSTNPRFHQYPDNRYGLASWLEEPEKCAEDAMEDAFLENLKREFFDDFRDSPRSTT